MLDVLFGMAGVAILLGATFVGVVIYFAFKKPTQTKDISSCDSKSILSKGRSNVVKLRQLSIRVRNSEVRCLSEEICDLCDSILLELKHQPSNTANVRQFFNYYLPTLASMLMKYIHLEKAGVLPSDVMLNFLMCFENIKIAMNRMYLNMFNDDVLDLSVEMESLSLICKRDGLLVDEKTETQEYKENIMLVM